MVRHATIVASFWAVLAVPALCMGGLIMHACDCGDTIQCGRESACWNDSCGQIIARRESQLPDVDIAVSTPAADWHLPLLDADIEQVHESIRLLCSRINLPYPTSDIPLLL